MFEDTLLIIKADYLHKRKPVLLKLLQESFQIQTHRKVLFSPEHAAEFYQNLSDDKSFMFQVILLSKGNSEAFILTKENAISDLLNTMICYFTTSTEMELNVHVSKCAASVAREITFIFPNYIHEPIPIFEGVKFCKDALVAPMVDELYKISQSSTEDRQNWKVKLAEWLMLSNKLLPRISNQCSYKASFHHEEKGEQTTMKVKVQKEKEKEVAQSMRGFSAGGSLLSVSSAGSSMMMTSSSCITCSGFDSGEICGKPPVPDTSIQLIRSKTTKLSVLDVCNEEPEDEWLEIPVEDEHMKMLHPETEYEDNIDMGEEQDIYIEEDIRKGEIEITDSTHPLNMKVAESEVAVDAGGVENITDVTTASEADPPASEAEAPAPAAEAPAPAAEAPAPDAEAPAPDAEAPAPDAEAPAPNAEAPPPAE